VLVHASAATQERPENTIIASSGGWYDAGDYNKYVVNSGYTMDVFLMAYEQQRAYYDTLHLNIPESTLPVPDMLAEAMYNIRWMMTMQDTDGGAYHKLTEPDFEGFIHPTECQKTRYVVLKTTPATLDLAATLALAARIYAPYEHVYSGFVDEATEAAKHAYEWAKANPAIYYDQPAMNEQFTPAITTGAYDDYDAQDEFYWAATELYLLTHDPIYLNEALGYCPAQFTPATWGNVAELASLEWMLHPASVEAFAQERQAALLAHLQPYIEEAETSSIHRSPYGNRAEDFFWGCNSEGCCWRGIECLYAYQLTGNDTAALPDDLCAQMWESGYDLRDVTALALLPNDCVLLLIHAIGTHLNEADAAALEG
jgi:endoglucanase